MYRNYKIYTQTYKKALVSLVQSENVTQLKAQNNHVHISYISHTYIYTYTYYQTGQESIRMNI